MKNVGIIMGVLLLAAGMASAAVIITEDFADVGSWTVAQDPNLATTPGDYLDDPPSVVTTYSPGNNALEFHDTDAPPSFPLVGDEDYIGTTGDGLVGNFTTLGGGPGVQNITFDFYADDVVPGQVQLYFYSLAAGTTWYSPSFDSQLTAGSWTRGLSIGFQQDQWLFGSNWDTAIQNVDAIGVYLSSYGTLSGNQDFAMDNFQLDDDTPVPEPQTYAMLGFAVLSMGFTFRRRLEESLGAALQTLRS